MTDADPPVCTGTADAQHVETEMTHVGPATTHGHRFECRVCGQRKVHCPFCDAELLSV